MSRCLERLRARCRSSSSGIARARATRRRPADRRLRLPPERVVRFLRGPRVFVANAFGPLVVFCTRSD
jgi:hypothetical protein